MNNLFTKQNEDRFIGLLAAQRRLYTEGKRINSIILFVTLMVALFIPLVVLYDPDVKDILKILFELQ